MARRRCRCGFCGRNTAITPTGRLWTHGTPPCPGAGQPAQQGPHWANRHYGRNVVTLPDIADWAA